MAEIRTSHLLTLQPAVSGMKPIGETPGGNHRIGRVAGDLRGAEAAWHCLRGGAGWVSGRPDRVTTPDVRIVPRTDRAQRGDAMIGMTNRGLRHGPAAVTEKVNSGRFVDRSEYYFRTVVNFETTSPRYAWLNKVFGIGAGSRPPEAAICKILEVL